MANTVGHTMRRYLGHKLYLATIAQRKATLIADAGADPADAPFWSEAICVCERNECAECVALADSRDYCTCTPAMRASWECCGYCELASIYSDVYKERNGIRPRHSYAMTRAELDDAIRWYYANPIEQEDIEPIVPTSGDGWTLITDRPYDAEHRLADDWMRG